jgi:hypothetical protein
MDECYQTAPSGFYIPHGACTPPNPCLSSFLITSPAHHPRHLVFRIRVSAHRLVGTRLLRLNLLDDIQARVQESVDAVLETRGFVAREFGRDAAGYAFAPACIDQRLTGREPVDEAVTFGLLSIFSPAERRQGRLAVSSIASLCRGRRDRRRVVGTYRCW